QPHPIFSYRVDLINENTANAHGGFHFPMAQKTESAGEIDFAALIEQSAAGMDVEAQKKIIEKLAMGFNELLPIIPLWERLANDPILVDVRVTGFPPDSDPLFKNSVYSDNFTMRWILDGTLKGVK
ncbi:MAG: ABC transporter substrate-binding protein, partial [Thermomicrobiales bacterium]